ncbi:MAG: hypothetical protein ACTS4T_01070 [Candidatus Hodgkinia cicadicola]
MQTITHLRCSLSKTPLRVLSPPRNRNPFAMSKQPETPLALTLRKPFTVLPSVERSPEAVLTASKEAIAAVCKVSPSALTFALNVPSLLRTLILSLLTEGDEVILCDRELSLTALQVFTSLAFPVIAKGENFQTLVRNILSNTNPKTKLVCMLIPSNFRNLSPLQHFRNCLPPHVTLALNFGRTNFSALASSPSAEAKLTGNTIVLRMFPRCSPPFNLVWMHAKALRISPPPKLIVNPFTINKVTKTLMVNAINDFRRWSFQASESLFWGTKLASKVRSSRLILRNVQPNHVTMQLIKRLPSNLVQQWLKTSNVPISRTTNDCNTFNSIKFRLTSSAANFRSAKSLSSLKTMAAVVKTTCAPPFNPSPALWTKVPPPLAASRSPSELPNAPQSPNQINFQLT